MYGANRKAPAKEMDLDPPEKEEESQKSDPAIINGEEMPKTPDRKVIPLVKIHIVP